MNQNQKKIAFAIGGIFVVLFILYQIGALPSFSLISSDYNVQVDNGKVYHVVTLTANDPNGGTYVLKPQNKTLSNGSIVASTETVSFELSPQTQRCEYQLTALSQPVIFGYSFNLWKEYTLKNAELKAPIIVSASNGNEPIILEGSRPGQRGTITDKDGNGIAEVETLGGFTASSYCPPSTGVVMVLDASGKPKVMSETQYSNKKDQIVSDASLVCGAICLTGTTNILCTNCVKNAFNDIKYGTGVSALTSYHSTPIKTIEAVPYGNTSTKTLLRLFLDSGAIYANPAVVISADQDFVDSFIYNAPAVGKPEIVSFSTISVPESKTVSRAAVFGNDGDSATFTYTVTAKLGHISPSGQQVEIEKDSQKQVTFSYSAPSVTADDEETITVKLCAGNQFGGQCTQKIYTFDVKNDEGVIPTPDPDTEWCGNGVCKTAVGENPTTCPADCTSPTPTTCDATKHLTLQNGECICMSGYLTRFDSQTGMKSCIEPSPDWMEYLPYVVLGGAVLLLGYAVFAKPKVIYRSRRRRK